MMPRPKFRLAAGGDSTDVDCNCFFRTPGGAPDCSALTHPWCLAAGSAGPEGCKFRRPREAQTDGKE